MNMNRFVEDIMFTRNKIKFALIFTLVASLVFIEYNREEIILRQLVSLTGAQIVEYDVSGWVRAAGETEETATSAAGIEPVELAVDAAKKMGLAEICDSPARWENSMARGAQVSGALPGGAVASVTAQVLNVPGSRPATHLMVRVTGVRLFAARPHKDAVRSVLSAYGKDHRAGITVKGILSGGREAVMKIPEQMAEPALTGEGTSVNTYSDMPGLSEMVDKMMAAAGAEIKERTQKENLVSLTGNTGKLAEGLFYDGREVNLNVACRYNRGEDAVYVYAATPLILIEY
jgi:hypothetical protein